MFGFIDKNRLLNAEIEIEKLRLENESLQKKLDEAADALQIVAANQAYLAKEVVRLTEELAARQQNPQDDPIDEYIRNLNKKGSGGGYLN